MARKIIGSLFTSLDGVIQAPGGPNEDYTGGFDEGGWVFKMDDEGIGETLGQLFANPFDLLLGRRTYDIFAAYWPYVGDEDGGIGPLFTGVTKYVLTHHEIADPWENTQRLSTIEDIARLKDSDGPDLLMQGSGTLYPQLLAAGLLDEVTLLNFPVLLGQGKRWFGEDIPACQLDVSSSRVTDKGTIVTTYRPAGKLPPYPDENVPKPATSEREMRRQQAMKDGVW